MTNKINGIDVSEYFIDVVDEGGGTIDYKLLPNSERLLVEKIFEQNQQLESLQEENEKLKEDLKGETEQAQKWYQLETDKHFLALKFCKTLEEIRDYCEKCKQCVETGDEIILYTVIKKINEVLNDRD